MGIRVLICMVNLGIPAIRQHPKRITSFAEALEIEGVGEKTAHKVGHIIAAPTVVKITLGYGNN